MSEGGPRTLVRFGPYEADLAAGQLRKSGRRIRLQEKPFQVLVALIERPGEVITREELRQRLWAGDTFVDFDQSLNTAINKLREALGDSATKPRFVETLPKRGYRFTFPLEPGQGTGSELGDARSALASVPEAVTRAHAHLWQAATILFGLAALSFAILWFRQPVPVTEAPLRTFTLPLTEQAFFPAISPDGRHVAYITGSRGSQRLWVQDLDRKEPRVVAQGDLTPATPIWSSNSKSIAFLMGNEVKRIPAFGGPAETVCRLGSGVYTGGSWTVDGSTLFLTQFRRLFRVSAQGGTPELLFELDSPDNGRALSDVHALPGTGNRKVLYTVLETLARAVPGRIIANDLSTERREALGCGDRAVYSPSGHILYEKVSPPGIWAMPFSIESLRKEGEPFLIADGASSPSVSRDGTLVYLESGGAGLHQLVWRDRQGNHRGSVGQPQYLIRCPTLSPDGRSVVVSAEENHNRDIWIHQVDRPVKIRLTSHERVETWPIWSPRGDRVAFSSGRSGGRDLYVMPADGSGDPVLLHGSPEFAEYLTDWSADERGLLFARYVGGETEFDFWRLQLNEAGSGYEEIPVLCGPFNDFPGEFSPENRLVAYSSDESGQYEIYVCKLPDCRNRQRVSTSGGSQPRWRRDGKELFYVEGDKLRAVPVSTGPTIMIGSPRTLFSSPGLSYNPSQVLSYDVSPDGERFVIAEQVEKKPLGAIRVVQNWFAEFRDSQD